MAVRSTSRFPGRRQQRGDLLRSRHGARGAAGVVLDVGARAVLQEVADDVGAAGFCGLEQRRLPLLAGHRVGARDASGQAGDVGDARVHVGARLPQDLHRLQRQRDDVVWCAGAEHAGAAAPRADAGGRHERRDAGGVRQIDERAVREQQADDLVVERLRGADERRGAGREQVVGEAVVAAAAARLLERELRVRVDAGGEHRGDERQRFR